MERRLRQTPSGIVGELLGGVEIYGPTMPTFALYKRGLTAVARRWGGLPDDAPAPRWAIFLAGALAGCTATCLTYPLDVVYADRLAARTPD